MPKRKSSTKLSIENKKIKKEQSENELPYELSASLSYYFDIPEEPTYEDLMNFFKYIIVNKIAKYELTDKLFSRIIVLHLIIFPVYIPYISSTIFMKDCKLIYEWAREKKGDNIFEKQFEDKFKEALEVFKNYEEYKIDMNNNYMFHNYKYIWYSLPYNLSFKEFSIEFFKKFIKDIYKFSFIPNITELPFKDQQSAISNQIKLYYSDYKSITDTCCNENIPTYYDYLNSLEDLCDLSKPIDDSLIKNIFPQLDEYRYINEDFLID